MDPTDGQDAATTTEAPPEVGAEGTPASPSTEQPAAAEPPSPDAEASSEDTDEVFRLEDVPEELRPHAERLQKQFQATLTRNRQQDRQQVQQAEQAMQLVEALNDPDPSNRRATFEALADRIGYEAASEVASAAEEADEDPLKDLPEAVRERLSQVDELRQADERRKADERRRIVQEHVDDALDGLAENRDGEDLDENVERLVTLAALASPEQSGLPDVKQAIELLEAVEAAAVDRYVAQKRREAEENGSPQTDGSTGVEQADTSTPDGRLRKAMAIAARHLDG